MFLVNSVDKIEMNGQKQYTGQQQLITRLPSGCANASVMELKIYNPIQKDRVTFLKTYADTNGE
jgi:hypothetical protein